MIAHGNRRSMIEIEINEGDRIEWALKQFRRKMLRSGLFKDMKRKRFYEKPSEAKKRKQADARRRSLRARRRK
jgi:small subunit ribosomal protein S21